MNRFVDVFLFAEYLCSVPVQQWARLAIRCTAERSGQDFPGRTALSAGHHGRRCWVLCESATTFIRTHTPAHINKRGEGMPKGWSERVFEELPHLYCSRKPSGERRYRAQQPQRNMPFDKRGVFTFCLDSLCLWLHRRCLLGCYTVMLWGIPCHLIWCIFKLTKNIELNGKTHHLPWVPFQELCNQT